MNGETNEINQTNQTNTNVDINMISLVDNIKTKKISVDFSKKQFTKQEKELIRKEVEVVKEKYPNYIPIIVRPKSDEIKMSRYKFLVGGEITIGQFLSIIRKKMQNIKSSEAIFLLVNNILAPSTQLLSMVYREQCDSETNMLFFTLCKESTFGIN